MTGEVPYVDPLEVINDALVEMTNDLIVDDIEQNEGNATAIVVSVVAVIAVALTIYLCIYGFKISKSTAAQG